jgi:hypothetical protein
MGIEPQKSPSSDSKIRRFDKKGLFLRFVSVAVVLIALTLAPPIAAAAAPSSPVANATTPEAKST